MNNNFLKIFFSLLISFLGYSQQNIASIEIIHFDSSLNYAPGSSVSIHFNPSGIYDFRNDGDDNQFYIELSNSSGTFDNDTSVLDQSISDSFFTTTLNGIIPTIDQVGTYKLRVIATKALLSDGTYGQLSSINSVDITILTNFTGDILTTYSSTPNSADLFDCSDQGVFYTDAMFGLLLAESSTTSGFILTNRRKIRVTDFDLTIADYNIKRVDVINDDILDIGSLQNSSHTISGNLGIGTYNFQVTKTLSNGISSSYSIVFVLHRSTTTIANDSGEEICIGNNVNFNIDTSDAGIGQNYRGSYYTIDFGDGSDLELYTHAEILYDNTLSHIFGNLSCDSESGYFIVDKQQFNKYKISNSSNCEYRNIGNGVQKNINTSLSPEAFFDSNSTCEDQDLVVTNLTTLGQYGTNGCSGDATFYWEISSPNGDEFFPTYEYGEIYDDPYGWLTPNDFPDNNLYGITIPSSQVIAGCWEFRLIAINDDYCQTVSYFPSENEPPYIVNIDTLPENSGVYEFDIINNNNDEVSSICVSESVTLIDNSNLNSLNCQNPTYNWTISPDQGFSFINFTNENSQFPQINFNQAGVYTITQEITNLCGTAAFSQDLLIEGSPSVSFPESSDQICVISSSIPYVVDFSSIYIPNYSDIPYAPSSFLWSISGNNIDQSDYNYINGTSENDPYPIISFNSFKDFTLSLTVDGDCQDSNSDQIILFINQIPEINNSINSQILCSGDFSNDILFQSSLSSGVNYSWTANSDSYISGYFNNGVGSVLPSHQLTNSSNVSGTVTYTVTPFTNDCVGETTDFIFTINPKPIISDKTLVICSNQSFNLINSLSSLDILPDSTIFTWDLPISSPENAVSGGFQGSDSNIIQTLTNNTTSPATLSYVVSSSTIQGCNDNNFSLNVIVNPTAQVDQPLDQVICNGDTTSIVEFTTENTGGTTTYAWINNTPSIGLSGSGSGDILAFTATNITTAPIVATITVTPTFENEGIVCDGEDKTFTITVNPTAQVDQPLDQVVCNEEDVNVLFTTQNTLGSTSYSWISDIDIGAGLSGNDDMDFTANNLTTEPIVATITVTPTFENEGIVCDGEDKTFTITVNPTAQVDQPLDQVVCNEEDVNVLFTTQNTLGSTSYSWISDIDIGAGLSGNDDMDFTANNLTTEPIVATITVTPTFENEGIVCDGEDKTFTITVNPTVVVNTLPDQYITSGQTSSSLNISSNTTNVTFNWTAVADSGITGLINSSSTGTTFIPAETLFNSGTAPLDVTYTIYPVLDSPIDCPADPIVYKVIVNPTPSISFIEDKILCNEQLTSIIFISGTSGGNETYNWISDIDIGAGLSGTGDMNFTANNLTTEPIVATIIVTPSFENGGVTIEGDSVSFTITVNPTAQVDQPLDQVICNGDTTSIVEFTTENTGGTTTYAWINNTPSIGLSGSGSGDILAFTATNITTAPIVATITVTPTFENEGIVCDGEDKTFTITVNPTAQVDQPLDQVICNGDTTSIVEFTTENTGGTTTYAWINNTPSIGLSGSGSGDILAFTATNITTAPIVATITVTPTFENEGIVCDGEDKTFTITVNPTAQVDQPLDQVVCNEEDVNVLFTTQNTLGSTSYSWISDIDIGAGLSGNDDMDFTANNLTTEPIVATITVTPTFENEGIVCDGEDKTFTITVNPTVVVNTLPDQYITSGQTSSSVNISSNTTNVTFNWTAVADSGITGLINSSSTGTTFIPAETLFNSGTAPLDVTYTIYPVLDSPIDCPADPIVYKVIVNPIASVISVEDQLLCNEEGVSVLFNTQNTLGSTSYNWISDIDIGAGLSGTGDMNFTANNLTTEPIVATITVTPTFENGGVTNEGDSVLFTITVNSTAQVDQPLDQVICNGDTTSIVEFTTENTGGTTTYAWINNTPSIGLSGSGSGDILAFTATNITTAPIVATITVTPTFENEGIVCDGEDKTFTITVNPTAQVDQPLDQVVCNEEDVNVLFTTQNTLGSTSYSWISDIDIGAGLSGNDDMDFTANNLTTEPIVATITVTPTFENEGIVCDGEDKTFTITVNPTAQVDQPLDQVVYHQGTTISVLFTTENTGGTTTYAWINNTPSIGLSGSGSGDILAFTANNLTTEPIVATITVTPSFENGGVICYGEDKTFTITVNPTAQVDDITDQVICHLDEVSVLFSTQNTSGTSSYSWTSNVDIGAGLSGTGDMNFTATNLTSEPIVATTSVIPSFTSGGITNIGDVISFTITVNPTAQVDQPLDQVVCNEEDVNVLFTTQNTLGSTSYSWISDIDIGAGLSGNDDMDFTANNLTTEPIVATITVTPTFENEGIVCDGEDKTFTITVNPTAQVDQPLDQVICNGDTTSIVEFTTENTGGTTTYAWINNTPSIGLSGSGSGDILAFTATNITTAPIVATITVTPTFENEGIVCDGEDKTFTITVNPTAQVDQPLDQVVCNEEDVNVLFTTQNTLGSTSYSWISDIDIGAGLSGNDDMDFTANNLTTEPIVATITVTPTFENEGIVCDGEDKTFTITVNPTAQVDQPLDQVICNGDTTSIVEFTTENTGGTTTYAWINNTPSIGLSGSGSGDILAFTATNITTAPIVATITVTPTFENEGIVCDGEDKTFTITVNPTAQVDQPLDQVVCNEEDVNVLFTTQNTLGSTSYSWISDIDIGAGLSGNDDMDFTANNLTTEPIVATITVTPTFENEGIVCDGEDKTFTITVNPNADMNGVEDQVVCHGESTESIIFSTNNFNGVMSYTWTNDTPSIGLSANGSGDILSFTAINTNSAPITANIIVTPTFGFDNVVCDGEQKIFTITVNPTAQVEQPEDQTVCNGDDVTVEFFTNNAVGNISYTWFTDIDVGSGLTGEGDLNFTAINQTTSPIISNISVISSFEDGLNNCSGTVKNFVIKVNPTAQVNSVEDIFICEGEMSSVIDFTTINSNGVISYTWINDNTDIGLAASGVGPIESFVAENPTNEIIIANLIVTPTYSNDGVLCLGPSENFSISVSPMPEMNEVITNVDCSYSEPLCVASIQISPEGIGPFVYNWVSLDGNDITNPSNPDQFDLCPGTYRVTVTDGSNCSYSYEYQIIPPEPIEFTLVTLTNLSCNNIGSEFCDGSIEISTNGGSFPYALQEWYTETIPGSGDFDLGPLVNINDPNQLVNACQGNYVYKVLDAYGCEFISPVYTVDAAPGQVNITETISNYNGYNIDCFSSNSGSLEIEVSGGSGIFDFSLTNDQTGQIIDSSQNQIGPLNLVFDFLTAGDYTFILIDSNCSSEIIRNYNLTQPDELQIIATLVSPPTCYSGLATYDISATGGVPPYIGTGLQSILSGPASFTVFDSNDCSDDYSTIVADPEELLAEYSTEDALCFGGNGLITINPDGGTGIITVNIYDENFLFIESSLTSQNTPISFIQPNGTYFFDFYDANDCYFGPQLVVINEPDPILVDIDIIQPNCNSDPEWSFNNGSICISITGGSNPIPNGVNWIDNGNGNWCLTDLSDGIYPVVIVDENGCEPVNEIQNVVLTSPTPITVDFNSSIDVDCDTNTITQTNFIFIDGGQPPYEITWSGGIYDPLNSNIMETSVEGNYSAFVNDQLGILNGCPPLEFQLDPIIFQQFGYSDFTFNSANSDFCDIFAVSDPVNFTNISNGDVVNFEWNFGDGSPVITNIQSPTHVYDVIGDYNVVLTVEDVYGCTDSYSQIIEITKGYEIINPNAFTPNGDGINDTIRPVYNCMTNVKMSIYDTWGSLIYTESGENIYGWDGNIDGNPAENGNYIMVVEAETFNGRVLNLNGPVTLIK